MESTCENHELQSELVLDFQESDGIEQITSMGLTQFARLVASDLCTVLYTFSG